MTSDQDRTIISAIMNGPADLRGLFRFLPAGVVIVNDEGRVIYYNPDQSRRDGLSEEEALGSKLADLYPKANWPTPDPAAPKARPLNYQTRAGRQVEAAALALPLTIAGRASGLIYLITEPTPELPGPAAPAPGPRPASDDGDPSRPFSRLIGVSPKFAKAVSLGRTAALSPSPVLLSGETGTGKELFARGIHEHSPRAARPFVPINCSAIPPDLLEGLLFGTTKGAFTGATDKSGLFEEAHLGTLFLDELDSMPLKLQPKLLRALQEKRIRRVGSHREVELDVKIISAVSGTPDEIRKNGRLRPDLFFRLGVMIIALPPLRERPEDLPLLAEHFIAKHNRALGRRVSGVSPPVMEAFQAYGWPGNVREFEHIIEASINVAEGETAIEPDLLPDHFSLSSKITLNQYGPENAGPYGGFYSGAEDGDFGPPVSLKDKEKSMIARALTVTDGNVAKAARLLDISRQLLVYKMKKHGLDRQSFKS